MLNTLCIICFDHLSKRIFATFLESRILCKTFLKESFLILILIYFDFDFDFDFDFVTKKYGKEKFFNNYFVIC